MSTSKQDFTFIDEMQELLQQGAIIGYLDEAWKYLRMKMKHLPRAEFEEEGADRIQARRVISSRNPVKTMFMGVVFQP
jgi:hypothetical protein